MAFPVRLWQICFVLFPAIALLHQRISPYTKVEESFNIQAIHDILQYGVPVSEAATKFRILFDHMTSPGAVPRTFIGSLVVSGLSKPGIWLGGLTGQSQQNYVRGLLGVLIGLALALFARAVKNAYGPIAALWYVALQASQFHLWYYASRTLPNMFAFFLSTIALAYLLPKPTSTMGQVKRTRLGLYLTTIAAVVFRSELALLLGAHCLWLFLKPQTFDLKVRLIRIVFIPSIVPGALVALLLTISIDTYFWQSQSYLWPEFSAFLSNVFPSEGSQGASEWGTQPLLWYFVDALPRLLMSQILMLDTFANLFDSKASDSLIPSLIYTASYSLLSHKETRFMFPIVPSLTLVAALTCTRLSIDAHKSTMSKLFLYAAILSTIIQAFISHGVLLPLSAQNYPGGQALEALHRYHHADSKRSLATSGDSDAQPQIRVHLTNLALQSGITRFLEQPSPNQYPVLNFNRDGNYINPTIIQPHSQSFDDRAYHDDDDTNRPPIILPGDASHPALTIRPKPPQASSSPAPVQAKEQNRSPIRPSNNPMQTWLYDKTPTNESHLLNAAFWDQFDYAIVESPAHAIGAWEVVGEIEALGRPRLLSPGSESGGGTNGLLHAMYPDYIARPLSKVHEVAYGVLREGIFGNTPSLTGGYWFEVSLETKLFVLQRSKSGVYPNADAHGEHVETVQDPSSRRSGSDLGYDEESRLLPATQSGAGKQATDSWEQLGPLVVNKDGTLSRLDNWQAMTKQERKRTVEYLRKRNMIRLEGVEAVAE